MGNKTVTKIIPHGILFRRRSRGRAFEPRRPHFLVGPAPCADRTLRRRVPTILATQKFSYPSDAIRFSGEFGSSCCKACADYSGYEDCRKRALIATVPDLLLRVFEGVAR